MKAILREWMHRLAGAFGRGRGDRDLEQELQTHLALAEDELRRQGMPPDAAAREARLRFGRSTQAMESLRDRRGIPPLSTFWLDAKLGMRMLRKSWGLTLVGGLAMVVAITIGASIFGFLHALSGTDLPLAEGDRVVIVQPWDPDTRKEQYSTVEDFERWRGQLQSVEDTGAFYTVRRNLVTAKGQSAALVVGAMSASGFRVARVKPLLGRPLLDEDEARGATPVVVLAYDAWQAAFAGDREAVGQPVQIDGQFYTVAGVMPPEFVFPVNHDAWIPLGANPLAEAGPLAGNLVGGNPGGEPGLTVFARLAAGVSVERADAEAAALGLVEPSPVRQTGPRHEARVVPYTVGITGNTDTWLVRLLGYVLALLLIPPCANIAILIYARTLSRQAEFATRSAVGASRGRIVGQIFVEVLVMALGAAAISLALASKVVDMVHNAIQQRQLGDLPFWMDFSLSYDTVFYVAGLAVFGAFLAGAIPALQATGHWRVTGLHALGARAAPRLGWVWTSLVVVQVALSVAAMPTALEFSWWNLRDALLGPGFPADRFLTAELTLTETGTRATADGRSSPERFSALRAELVRQLAANPAIGGVTVAAAVPSESPFFRIESVAQSAADLTGNPVLGRPLATVNQVDGAYFRTFQQRLISGRFFDATDLEPGRRTIVVNRSLAEMVFGAQNPLGRRVRFFVRGGPEIDTPQPWWEIVGVVSDRAANGTTGNAIYRPLPAGNPAPWVSGAQIRAAEAAAAQGHPPPLALILRTGAGGSGETAARLRALTVDLDPALRADQFRTMQEIHEEHIVGDILGGSALLAIMLGLLALSIAGIYTLMAFTVTQRRREIGIRAALGARPARLVGGIFRSVFVPVGWGAAVGAGVAALLEYYQSAIVLALMEGHVVTWVLPATEGFIVLVATLAILGPARRALRIDPLEALRDG